jgi:hypothetical protein
MQKLDRGGQLGSRPTPNAVVSPGYANNDLTQATAPTILDPDFCNALIDELGNVLAVAGIAFSKTDVTQLFQSLLVAPVMTDVGSVNALSVTPATALPAAASIRDRTLIWIVPANNNTSTTPTLVVSGGAASTITQPGGGAVAVNSLIANVPIPLVKMGGGSPVWWLLSAQSQIVPLTLASGQAQAVFTNTTHFAVNPVGPGNIILNGKQRQIPSAGIATNIASCFIGGVSGQAVANNQTYHAFLFDNSGTLTVDLYTTGHMTDTNGANLGVEVRSNGGTPDSTRSYIAILHTDASGHIAATTVRSWFNRGTLFGSIVENGATTTSNTLAELSSSFRIPAVMFADDVAIANLAAGGFNTAAGDGFNIVVGVDGAGWVANTGGMQNFNTAGLQQMFASSYGAGSLSEGFHHFDIFGAVFSTGTATINSYLSLAITKG